MTVVPPPLTADAMAAGAIDGFCVNAPWNMIAVERGIGRVVAVKADIWPAAPEFVMGVRPDWAESQPETLSRLIVALHAAARWCDVPENRPTLAAMLAEPGYVGGSPALIGSLLTEHFLVDPDGTLRDIPNYLTFHCEAANFSWVSEALWLFSHMTRWGQAQLTPQAIERASALPTRSVSLGAGGLLDAAAARRPQGRGQPGSRRRSRFPSNSLGTEGHVHPSDDRRPHAACQPPAPYCRAAHRPARRSARLLAAGRQARPRRRP